MEKVYFVSAPGRIKIGFTRRPEKRLKALRLADMEELTVIAIIDGPRALEKKLHGLLKDHRLRGEWFVDCAEVRQVVDDAVAGMHAIPDVTKRSIVEVEAPVEEDETFGPEKYSPEYKIIVRLIDEVHAALDREDDKYVIRGRVSGLYDAVAVFLEQRQHIHKSDPPK